MCLPSDALLKHLPSYLGFSYLERGVSLHGCSSKVQPLLLTLDKGYLLTTALPDLQRGIVPLGPPVPAQPWLLGLLNRYYIPFYLFLCASWSFTFSQATTDRGLHRALHSRVPSEKPWRHQSCSVGIYHMLDHKERFSIFKKTDIISNMPDHNVMRLETS